MTGDVDRGAGSQQVAAAGPYWSGPGSFGQPAAFDALMGVAAPLLAGFSLALLGVVGQSPGSFRWPGPAMLVLVCACITLVTAIQFGFRARARLYSRAEVEAWEPLAALTAQESARLRAQVQRQDMARWRTWYRRCQVTYNTGIVLLAAAVALIVAPPDAGAQAGWRWAAFGIAVLAGLAELAWIAAGEVAALRERGPEGRDAPAPAPAPQDSPGDPAADAPLESAWPVPPAYVEEPRADGPGATLPSWADLYTDHDAPTQSAPRLSRLCHHQVPAAECPRCTRRSKDDDG